MNSIIVMNPRRWLAIIPKCFCESGAARWAMDLQLQSHWPGLSEKTRENARATLHTPYHRWRQAGFWHPAELIEEASEGIMKSINHQVKA